jgi:ATP-dependent exoDNAse (exonuclease V) beta subunit
MSCEFFSWCGVLDPSGRREANALKFLSKLATAERQAGFVPRRFVDEVLGGGDRGSDNESNDRDAVAAVKPDRIHLMTIHVSKGLEFDHVFLPFLGDPGGKGRATSEFILHEQKRLWSVGLSIDEEAGFSAGPLAREWNSILQTWGIEEQKRLLYVALTRAREIALWYVAEEQDEAREALRWLLALDHPNLPQILANGEVEWSFTYLRDEYAVDGQIDLWGRDGEGKLWVLDYKTGDPSYRDKALRQLQYYAEALIASGVATNSEEIFLCALYPFSKEVFTEKLVRTWSPKA